MASKKIRESHQPGSFGIAQIAMREAVDGNSHVKPPHQQHQVKLKQLELDRQVLLRVLAEVVDHFYAFG